jgi:hypothetical protein
MVSQTNQLWAQIFRNSDSSRAQVRILPLTSIIDIIRQRGGVVKRDSFRLFALLILESVNFLQVSLSFSKKKNTFKLSLATRGV